MTDNTPEKEVVTVHPDGVVQRHRTTYEGIRTLLYDLNWSEEDEAEWPILIDLGDGLAMVISEAIEEDATKENIVAKKILSVVRGVAFPVKGTAIFFHVDKNKQLVDAPKWVEVVLKNSRNIHILFE
jgi:hypothetical protein